MQREKKKKYKKKKLKKIRDTNQLKKNTYLKVKKKRRNTFYGRRI